MKQYYSKTGSTMDESQPKKSKFPILTLFSGITVSLIVALLFYSYYEKSEIKEMQGLYHTKIQTIETYLNEGNCTQAAFEYVEAKVLRDDIVKRGLYYSMKSHAKQAHEIEIAECFADRREFEKATEMLHIEENNDPDYLSRASVIFKNSGDLLNAQKAKAKGEEYGH
jgi:hypothetical protein